MTNDGLVAFKRAGGGEGTQSCPTSHVAPDADGRRQDVHVPASQGIRYSTGGLVNPATSARHSNGCSTTDADAPHYYTGIRGGADCVKQPSTCDLPRGIVTDDQRAR